MFYRLILREAS